MTTSRMEAYNKTYVSHIFDSTTTNIPNINTPINYNNNYNNKQLNSNNIEPLKINNKVQLNKNNQNQKKMLQNS